MKWVRSIIFALVALLSCPTFAVGQLSYVKGQSRFTVGESDNEWVVTYYRSDEQTTSRNRNIADRKLRIDAIDIMGAYQLYGSFAKRNGLKADYFQLFCDAIGYHYAADVSSLRRKDSAQSITFTCPKEAYIITEADFPVDVNLADLIRGDYNRHRNSHAAEGFYHYKEFGSADYISLMHDYLSGRAQLDPSMRDVQRGGIERLENSIYDTMDNMMIANVDGAAMVASMDTALPFAQFAFIELTTSAPAADKQGFFEAWATTLEAGNRTLWEDMLLFVARECATPLPAEYPTVSECIAAFPGAISPYGVRQATDKTLYQQAEAAYAASDTDRALQLLHESLSNDGISAAALNLTGAVYRYTSQPKRALPYLLLGFMIDPETRFLAGNLILSLDQAGYHRTDEVAAMLKGYMKLDSWSAAEVDKALPIVQ